LFIESIARFFLDDGLSMVGSSYGFDLMINIKFAVVILIRQPAEKDLEIFHYAQNDKKQRYSIYEHTNLCGDDGNRTHVQNCS